MKQNRSGGLADRTSATKVPSNTVKAIVAIAVVIAIAALVRWMPASSGSEISFSSEEEQESEGGDGEDGGESDGSGDESLSEYVMVHVVGAVNSPGVYSLVEGSRVNDAVEAAGGFTADASTSSANLAREVVDGEQIVIYTQEEVDSGTATTASSSSSGTSSSGTSLVNINTATAEELEELSGIGPVTAQAIVDYRTQNGNFQSIEDIKDVSGIGDAKYEAICDSICV